MTILVAGGGEGSSNLLKQVRALAWRERPWQVIAVCGRNDGCAGDWRGSASRPRCGCSGLSTTCPS